LAGLIGGYDGFFGPGAGAFYVANLLKTGRVAMVGAIANAKYLNGASNLAALIILAPSGHVLWGLGLGMGMASFIGGQVGARLAIRFGSLVARPLLVIMCLALSWKVLASAL
jgi:uncharacterized membrane protein YfcA